MSAGLLTDSSWPDNGLNDDIPLGMVVQRLSRELCSNLKSVSSFCLLAARSANQVVGSRNNLESQSGRWKTPDRHFKKLHGLLAGCWKMEDLTSEDGLSLFISAITHHLHSVLTLFCIGSPSLSPPPHFVVLHLNALDN